MLFLTTYGKRLFQGGTIFTISNDNVTQHKVGDPIQIAIFFLPSNGVDFPELELPSYPAPVCFAPWGPSTDQVGNCSCELYPVWCCCCPRQVPPITHGKAPRVEIGNCPCGGKPRPQQKCGDVFLSFFLSMEGSIQTSLFSWLRFPQNFLRLCHSHVFWGSNQGDVCCGSKSNPI